MFFSTPFTEKQRWEPEMVLGLINPDRHYITCAGCALSISPPRRCRNQISAGRYSLHLSQLSQMDPSEAAKSNVLYSLAENLLCYHHGRQAYSIVIAWQKAIEDHVRSSASGKNSFKMDDFGSEEFARLYELQRWWAAFQASQQKNSGYSTNQQKSHGEKFDTGAGKGPDCKGDEKSSNTNKKEEQPKQEKGSDSFKAKAQQSENRSKTSPPPSLKPWSEVWSKYLRDWEAIEADPTDRDVKVPWPVRSGKFNDVTKTNVREFFANAPMSGGPFSASDLFSLMSSECKRWHPDKLFSRFDCLSQDEVKETTNMIIILVKGLWSDAKTKRNQQRAANL